MDLLVDYQKAVSIRVGNFLLSKGFDLASSTGVYQNKLGQSQSLGILRKDPERKTKTRLFSFLKKRDPRRIFHGIIWFKNNNLGASEDNWIFEFYGRRHVALMQQLADEMASTFEVKVTLRLVKESPETEAYDTDFYWY